MLHDPDGHEIRFYALTSRVDVPVRSVHVVDTGTAPAT
jgi:hypothetical protein